VILAYKLVRVRVDGSFGSLFVDKSRVLPAGKWIKADLRIPPRRRIAGGRVLVYRPGWHAVNSPRIPHLTGRGRAVVMVFLRGGVREWKRPGAQGGTWFTARQMLITGRVYRSFAFVRVPLK